MSVNEYYKNTRWHPPSGTDECGAILTNITLHDAREVRLFSTLVREASGEPSFTSTMTAISYDVTQR